MFRKQIRITLPGMMPKIMRAVCRGMLLTAAAMFWSCADGDAPGRVLSTDRIAFHASAAASGGSRSDFIASGRSFPESIAVKIQGRPDSLYIHTVVSDRVSSESRGVPVASLSDHGSFGVFAHLYTGAWEQAAPTLSSPYMNDIKVTEGSDGIWNPQGLYYWPAKGHNIRFFAYAPHGAAAYSGDTGNITYTVPDEVTAQPDLLAACSGEYAGGEAHTAVPLAFRHILTAVKFSTGDGMLPGKITRITLGGVHGAGEYDFTAAAWQLTSRHDFTFTQTLESQLDGTPGVPITPSAATFMMMPQTLPAGAKITLEFTDNISEETYDISASIAGAVWEPGKTIEYRISTNPVSVTPVLTVSAPSNVTYLGGTRQYRVTSYMSMSLPNGSVKVQEKPWTTEFYDYNSITRDYDIKLSAKPSWVTEFTDSDQGSTSSQTYSVTVAAQTGTIMNQHIRNLQNATERGTESSPYDLSMYTVDNKSQSGGMTTANCYVISAPGWYRLPLVYGCAVKNGNINTYSYNPNGTYSSTFLKPFVKHDNASITAPCLSDNSGVSPSSAALLWNDTGRESFISVQPSIRYFNAIINGYNKWLGYIVFYVPKENICQGNAVIAVRNSSGVILWSWHIWVTDENLASTIGVSNYMNETNYMMRVNLGYCDGITESYTRRSVKIVFIQKDSEATQSFILTQTEGSISNGSNNPYYQWGRKDPFLPSDGNGNTDKICYGTKWTYSSASATTGMNIQHPTIFYNVYSKPNVCEANNLWSANNTLQNVAYNRADEPVIKTVYDPCPPGFHVAPTNAYTGFTTTGANTSVRNQFNVSKNWDNSTPGWYFYTHKSNKTNTIFFPASGYRLVASGTLNLVKSYGFVWTALPVTNTQGRYLRFYSTDVSPVYNTDRSIGFPVRPVRE